jgi:hypothetical protein
MNTATATTPKNVDPAESVLIVHPAEKWMFQNIHDYQFWLYYRAKKEEYARFTAQDVARLAQRTNTDFWFLVFNLGLGIEVITVDQVKEYYNENRKGYTVDTVATYE